MLTLAEDFFNASSLNDITQWHIFEQVFTQSDLKNILSTTKAKDALKELAKINKLQEFFPNERISSIDDFINKITEINVFETIYK
ncbi:hypothetical protein AX016_2237 [Cellulophaga sp. RHA19]|uniref:hypothetical protein n=1 Tax=Cellulophaga sp. RHA19 TaxID=1798237 RepID=UPI000C2C851A|nr:hypothetical protein [Cellulophaga sp. RHA19]PKB44026.1 hypothetical protein AX016_2237 [Cellulophaga sp. RHA19]